MKFVRSFAVALALTASFGATSAHALTRAEIMAEQRARAERAAADQIERDGFSATAVSTFAGAHTARLYAAQRARSANNAAAVAQNGNNNGAYVAQAGQNNGVAVTQNNNNNRAYVAQIGRDLGLGVTQNGGARTVVIQTNQRVIVRDLN